MEFKRFAQGTQVEIELADPYRTFDGAQRFTATVFMSYPTIKSYIVTRPEIPGWRAAIDAWALVSMKKIKGAR